jgi:hypothetical protein
MRIRCQARSSRELRCAGLVPSQRVGRRIFDCVAGKSLEKHSQKTLKVDLPGPAPPEARSGAVIDRRTLNGRSVRSAAVTTKIYDIGPFRLDTEAGVLTKAGEADGRWARARSGTGHAGGVPTNTFRRPASWRAAWPGVVVEESNLAVQISSLRRCSRKRPAASVGSRRLARRGYRYVGPVTALDDSRDPAWQAARDRICPSL